jgi:hypothetical protein
VTAELDVLLLLQMSNVTVALVALVHLVETT